jgi:hypothetical protein
MLVLTLFPIEHTSIKVHFCLYQFKLDKCDPVWQPTTVSPMARGGSRGFLVLPNGDAH